MFRGTFEHAVDSQGRVAIPARYREVLGRLRDERLVVTRFVSGQRRAIDAYPLSVWEKLEQALREKGRFNTKHQRFLNYYVAGCHECPIDSQGRIQLPGHLREHANLKKDVVFTGEIDMFRIWDAEAGKRAAAEDLQAFADDPNLLADIDL